MNKPTIQIFKSKSKLLTGQIASTKSVGYTLVELLVVIGIMAVLGTVVIAGYSQLQKDAALNQAVADLQSYIRTAQTNATTRVSCPNTAAGTGGAYWWLVVNTNGQGASIFCQLDSSSTIYQNQQKALSFPTNIVLINSGNTVAGNPGSVGLTYASKSPKYVYPGQGVILKFAPLYGDMTVYTPCVSPYSSCTKEDATAVTFTLHNNNSGSDRSITVDQGGSVHE